jgi:hypothetical protein
MFGAPTRLRIHRQPSSRRGTQEQNLVGTRSKSTFNPGDGSIVQNDIEQRAVDLQSPFGAAGVVNKT